MQLVDHPVDDLADYTYTVLKVTGGDDSATDTTITPGGASITPSDPEWHPQIPDTPKPEGVEPADIGIIELIPCPNCGTFKVKYLGKKTYFCPNCQTEYKK